MRLEKNTTEFANFDQPAGRAVGTVYQNTNGKPMLVTVCGSGDSVEIFIGNVDPPVVSLGKMSGGIFHTTSFIVPSGYYYKLTQLGAWVLLTWSEYF